MLQGMRLPITLITPALNEEERIEETLRGYGQAGQTALLWLHSETAVILFAVADGSDDPDDLPKLLAPIINGEANIIIGSQLMESAATESGSPSPVQRYGNRFADWTLRLFYGGKETDLGPFRAIRRDALERLRMRDTIYGWTIEMQSKAHRRALRIREVPVNYCKRAGRESKVGGLLHGVS